VRREVCALNTWVRSGVSGAKIGDRLTLNITQHHRCRRFGDRISLSIFDEWTDLGAMTIQQYADPHQLPFLG